MMHRAKDPFGERHSPFALAIWLLALCATVDTAARAEDLPSAAERLEPLRYMPLPGESSDIEMTDRAAIDRLVGRTVTRIEVRNPPPGLDPVEDANIPLGIALTPALVRQAVFTLFETGRYRDIRISGAPKGDREVVLVLQVEPMLRVVKLRLSGNKALDSDAVARAIAYSPGQTILPKPEVLRSFRAKLLAAYGELGYQEVSASVSIVATDSPNEVELTVEVTEGTPERYTAIHVQGLPDKVTPDILGIRKGMIRNREKVTAAVEGMLKALAEMGYVDAEILPVQEKRIGKYAMALTIPVKPGLPTEIIFRGNRYFLSRDLRALINKTGAMRTSPESISRSLTALKTHYRRHGFFFIEIHVERKCVFDEKGDRIQIQPLSWICGENALCQVIRFTVEEGPQAEVADVLFQGNTWFSDEELQEELFAYVSEKNKSDETFQPLDTGTVDDLGVSDKRPEKIRRPSGRKAPDFRRSRVYVPEQYRDGMDHLVAIYHEQGFLSARVWDTCPSGANGPVTHRRMRFSPLTVHREKSREITTSRPVAAHPCVRIDDDGDQLLVTVTVEEGPQTILQEIKFEGNRLFTSKELQLTARLSVSSPYNEFQLRESARKITERYREEGHMFADVTWDRHFSEDKKRARVVFTVKEGPEVRVGQIRIEGNETTRNRLILERLSLEPGDIITPEELEKSQMRLTELGLFNSVTVQMVSPENPSETKNIKIQVSESKPQYLELKWGIATVEGVRAGLEYGFNNIGGWAVNTRFRARANYRVFFIGNPDFEERYQQMTLMERLEHHVLVGIGSPHLAGTNGLLGWGIDLIKERLNKPGFSADRFTNFLRLRSNVALGRDYPRGILLEARTGIEYNIDIFAGISDNPFLRSYLRLPQGESAFYVVGWDVSLDLRNSPFSPSSGFFLSIGAEWVKSLPIDEGEERIPEDPVPIEEKSNLIRAQATASGYIPIFNTDMVLAVSVTAGYVFHLIDDSTTWPDRYFYVGGVDTLRGFPEDDLMPEDLYETWKSALLQYSGDVDDLLESRGGEAMFLARAELRYPLAGGFYGAGFAEGGNVWRDRKKMYVLSLDPFAIHLRPVAGLGLRYETPIGPVALDWGFNLNRRPFEDPFSWYFSIGSAF